MDAKIFFCCKNEYLIKADDLEFVVSNNCSPRPYLEIKNFEPILLSAYPLYNNGQNPLSRPIPFDFNLQEDNDDQLSSLNSNIKIKKLAKGVFEVWVSPLRPHYTSESLRVFSASLKAGAQNLEVRVHKGALTRISASGKGYNFLYSTFRSLSDFEASITKGGKQNFLIVTAKSKSDTFCLVAPTNDDKHYYDFCESEITHAKDTIVVTKKCGDMAKHIITTKYSLSENGIKKEASKISYEENKKPVIYENENISPLAFFEAVNVCDFPLAKKYLSPRFSDINLGDRLKDFFPKFSYVYKVKHNVFSLSDGKNCSYFSLSFAGNKIDNFDKLGVDEL